MKDGLKPFGGCYDNEMGSYNAMYCKKCGHKIQQGYNYCDKCGIPIPAETVEGRHVKVTRPWKLGLLVAGLLLLALISGVIVYLMLSASAGAKRESVLDGMREACGGELPDLEFDDAGNLRTVRGKFSIKKVGNKKEALAIVNDLAPLLGIENVDQELFFVREDRAMDTTTWWFAFGDGLQAASTDEDESSGSGTTDASGKGVSAVGIGIGITTTTTGEAVELVMQGIPDEQEVQVQNSKTAYAVKLAEYLGIYGEPSVRTAYSGTQKLQSAEGVCVAQLIDFDADGIDELLVVYYDRDAAMPSNNRMNDASAYEVEVWGYSDGKVHVVHNQKAQSDQGGFAYLQRLLHNNSRNWIVAEEFEIPSVHRELYYEITSEGSQVVHTYEWRNELTPLMKTYLDGEETDLSAIAWWESIKGDFSNIYHYHLMDNGNTANNSESEGYESSKCVELTKQTIQLLDINKQKKQDADSQDKVALSVQDACSQIELQAKEPVIYCAARDYDCDGHEEAFVVAGTCDDSFEGGGVCTSCELWFANSSGQIELVDSFSYQIYLNGNNPSPFGKRQQRGPITDTKTALSFLSLEATSGGSGSSSYVYGVNAGIPQRVSFDVNGIENVCYLESIDQIVGTTTVWNEGHKHQLYSFLFDETTFSFKTIEMIGIPSFDPWNDIGES